jgi:hypothetical protein
MLRSLVVVTLLIPFPAIAAQANDAIEFSPKARAAAVAALRLEDPSLTVGRDLPTQLPLLGGQELRGNAGACERTPSLLCYDAADKRLVYGPARAYMPKFDGLTAESVSLRHDRIVFKYTFR